MVCLLKDVKVQLKVRRTLSSVGTSSSNTTMPVGLIVFGDKSHTNLHGKLSLTPIILPLHCLIEQQEITPVFGGRLGTYQICPMEKGQQTVEVQVTRFKTNIHVYHAYLNHCAGLLDREDLIYVSLDEMLL